MTDELADRWPLADLTDVRDALAGGVRASPSRGYHDTLHLTEVLDRLDELADAGVAFDTTSVRARGVVPRRGVRRGA